MSERLVNLWTSLVLGPAVVSLPPDSRDGPDVAFPYAALSSYLDGRYAGIVVLTFGEIEDLLGFALPNQARSDSQWWTGLGITGDGVQAQAWIAAHRSAVPNLVAQTVVFERA